jgi:hypothetical protein
VADRDEVHEPRRDVDAELLAGVDAFDRAYYRRFGRFPEESGLTIEALRDDRRRAAIRRLVEQGATAGERAAARAALRRIEGHDAIGEFPAHYFDQDDPHEED